jgi:hypothetical protein
LNLQLAKFVTSNQKDVTRFLVEITLFTDCHKAELICPVTNNFLVELAQLVLAGIGQDWPADKLLKVYEICFSDEVIKVR